MNQDYINKLKRRLDRCKSRAESLNLLHTGNEANYTYHGGWSLGYLQGQIKELEDLLDEYFNHITQGDQGAAWLQDNFKELKDILTAGEISVIKRSASWRNPVSAIAESSTIIKNAAAGPARPSMSASQAKSQSK